MADAKGKDNSGNDREEVRLPAAYPGETVTRRRLFERAAVAVGGVAGAIIGLPAIGFGVGPVFKRQRGHWITVGHVSEFSPDTFVQKTVQLVKQVGEAGKSTVYVRARNPEVDPQDTPEFVAISTRCTHLGCPVGYVDASKRFVCPCHGGVFNFQGNRTGGPPVRPLDRFNTRVVGDEVQIGNRFSVGEDGKRFSPRDPGQAMHGLWRILYPRRFTTPSIHQ